MDVSEGSVSWCEGGKVGEGVESERKGEGFELEGKQGWGRER